MTDEREKPNDARRLFELRQTAKAMTDDDVYKMSAETLRWLLAQITFPPWGSIAEANDATGQGRRS